jgi:hypothetical protein
VASAQTLSKSGLVTASFIPRLWRDSEALNVDGGQIVGRGLKDVAVILSLYKLTPVSEPLSAVA